MEKYLGKVFSRILWNFLGNRYGVSKFWKLTLKFFPFGWHLFLYIPWYFCIILCLFSKLISKLLTFFCWYVYRFRLFGFISIKFRTLVCQQWDLVYLRLYLKSYLQFKFKFKFKLNHSLLLFFRMALFDAGLKVSEEFFFINNDQDHIYCWFFYQSFSQKIKIDNLKHIFSLHI